MNKKKFPKAVLRTADQMRDAGAGDAPKSAAPDNVIEMMPKSEGASTANIAAQPAAASADPATALRRRRAVAIVEKPVGRAPPISAMTTERVRLRSKGTL